MIELPAADDDAATTGPRRRTATGRDLASLRRWEEHGGAWQVVFSSERRVTVSLLRCDGGEEVDRFSSADPSLLRFIREQSTSGSSDG